MLLRFIVDNLFSFGSPTEFNLTPSKQSSKKSHHLYSFKHINCLKLSAIYGANGAGKSNLINAISFLFDLIESEESIGHILSKRFKRAKSDNRNDVSFGIEFVFNNTPYIYGIKLDRGRIVFEELYRSGLGKKENELIFERSTTENGENKVIFPESFFSDAEGTVMKDVVIKSYKNSKMSFLKLLSGLEHESFSEVRNAYNWFRHSLVPLNPDALYTNLVARYITDDEFAKFTNDMICSFHTGIKEVGHEKIELGKYLGENENDEYERIFQNLVNLDGQILSGSLEDERVAIRLENNLAYVYRLYFKHEGIDDSAKFYFNDESDGTKRLFEYVALFKDIIDSNVVYIIDEIERSIHPTIIKELIQKFSSEKNTKGQLIFSTHESNLLDQEIFRQDEIWFAEKTNEGTTKLYPLSDFEVHHSKNIQKGYLNGRYGAIPFTGNLNDLKWVHHETV
tara:strand:- start:709 stop:2067 length:1359 start_codon:yes stop_codon:yes gene_type:complete